MTCPHCDRKDFFSVSRQRSLVEFRMIKTERLESGDFKFDGNWKKEMGSTNMDARRTK